MSLWNWAANGTIVHPRIVHEGIWSSGRMILTGENRKARRKTYSITILATTKPTWTALEADPRLRGKKSATSLFSYGTAKLLITPQSSSRRKVITLLHARCKVMLSLCLNTTPRMLVKLAEVKIHTFVALTLHGNEW
jgi:hypothetical protein